MDGVLELLAQHLLAGVARHLQQEEARVALGQEVVRRVVLIQDLQWKNNNECAILIYSITGLFSGHINLAHSKCPLNLCFSYIRPRV